MNQMPRSSNEGKDTIKQWIDDIEIIHKNIIDIGVGQGTYKDLFGNLDKLKNTNWHGIEIWPRWIRKFNLKEKYDFLHQADVRNFDYKKYAPYDIAFAGDVLEHMTKDEAIDLVNELKIHATTVFISIPIVYMPQGADGGNPYEVHVKPDWSHEEVLETFSNIKKSWNGKKIGVYQIN